MFCFLTLLTTHKIKILKKWKKCLDVLSFYTCVPQMTIMIYGCWYIGQNISRQTKTFVIWSYFCLYTPLKIQKIKILKKWKTLLEISFTQVYHKWQSYDIWFLRYQMQQTNFFVIFGHFLAFYAPKAQKIKISKSWKKHLEISSFYTIVPKIMIIGYTIADIWCVPDVIIFHFELFFTIPLP